MYMCVYMCVCTHVACDFEAVFLHGCRRDHSGREVSTLPYHGSPVARDTDVKGSRF